MQQHDESSVGRRRPEPDFFEILREVASANLGLQGGSRPAVWGARGSGYGRELSTLGVAEFVNKKLILVANVSVEPEEQETAPTVGGEDRSPVRIPVNGRGGPPNASLSHSDEVLPVPEVSRNLSPRPASAKSERNRWTAAP